MLRAFLANKANTAVRSLSTRILSLSNLADNDGARKKRKILGRGPGSGLGKTCGKGHKGVFARRALGKRGFEGGQTPLWKRTPKYGTTSTVRKKFDVVNLDKIHHWITRGRLDPNQLITMKVIRDSGVMGNVCPKWGVKLLAKDIKKFKRAPMCLNFEVSDVSVEARKAVEAAGGKVHVTWFAPIPLRAHFKPEKYPIAIKSNGIPPPKKREKYREYMEDYLHKHPQFKERLWMPPPKEDSHA